MFSFKTFLIILTLVIYVRPSYERKIYARKRFSEDIINKMVDNVIQSYKAKLLHYLTESHNEMMSSIKNATSARRFPNQLHKVEEFDFDFFIIDQDFNRILNEIPVGSVSQNYLGAQKRKDESQQVKDKETQNWEEVWNSKWEELKKEMNPTTLVQSFSVINATEDMRKLVKKFLSLTTKYHDKQKEVRNMIWNLEQRIIIAAIEKLESILDESIVKDFKLKLYVFFGKLFDLIKQKRDKTENLDQLYKEVNRMLEYSRNFWMNQWITIKNLLKSDPEKLQPIVTIGTVEEQSNVTVLDTRFPGKLLTKYDKQVNQLKQLNDAYRKIVFAKLRTNYPQSLQQLSAILSEKPEPSRGGSELVKSNVVIRQLIYNYSKKIIKILHDNKEKLTNLWNQSLKKGVSDADFKQFYNNVNKEIKRLIKQIDLDTTLQELDKHFNSI